MAAQADLDEAAHVAADMGGSGCGKNMEVAEKGVLCDHTHRADATRRCKIWACHVQKSPAWIGEHSFA
jgi:hypothetical protein